MNVNKILITGATGNIGSQLIKILSDKNIPVSAGIKDLENCRNQNTKKITNVNLNFEDQTTFNAALKGVKILFLVRPPAISNVKKNIYPFIDCAVESGVRQIVFLSLMGVESNPITPHYKIEKYILQKNLTYTFIRPSFFMQNLSTTHYEDIKYKNEIFVPARNGKTSFIDVRDIAQITALALTSKVYLNKSLELSGSEALNYYEVAAIFTEVLGRKITYRNPSMLTFFLRLRKRKIQGKFIFVMIALYTVCKFGKAAKISTTFKEYVHKDPITFRQFVVDNKKCWI